MFVRLVKKKNDRVSVRIVENQWVEGKVKQKVICNFGQLHKDDQREIQIRMRAAEKTIIELKNDKNPTFPGLEDIHAPKKRKDIKAKRQQQDLKNFLKHSRDLRKGESLQVYIESLEEELRVPMGIDDIFEPTYRQLKLFDGIDTGYKKDQTNELFKQMVLCRIDDPVSKKKSVEVFNRQKGEALDLDRVYRMMDKVFENEQRIKDKIAGKTLSLFKEKIDVTFFDVTTLYFESFVSDELRKCGYSKDNKFKETQVVLALMTTREGLALGYELFPGNTYEGGTLIKAVNELNRVYDVSETFVVADRGMFTKSNLKAMDDRGVGFIVSAKLRTLRKQMTEEILRDVENKLKERENLKDWIKEYEYEGNRLIVHYSEKRADKDRRERERLIERIEKKMKGQDKKIRVSDLVSNRGSKKYLKMESKDRASLDEDKIVQESRWDGIYGVICNDRQRKFSGQEIMNRYRGLWKIEEAFRINKHDLKMRPIYHWTPKRIRAHILICFVAYALACYVRYGLEKGGIKMSFRAIREELSYRQASVLRDQLTGRRFFIPSKMTDKQKEIYKALNIRLDQKIKILDL